MDRLRSYAKQSIDRPRALPKGTRLSLYKLFLHRNLGFYMAFRRKAKQEIGNTWSKLSLQKYDSAETLLIGGRNWRADNSLHATLFNVWFLDRYFKTTFLSSNNQKRDLWSFNHVIKLKRLRICLLLTLSLNILYLRRDRRLIRPIYWMTGR